MLTNLCILKVLKELLKYSCPSYPTDTTKQNVGPLHSQQAPWVTYKRG